MENIKKLRIKRLEDTIEKLKTLKSSEFDYSSFVSKYEGDCGTVCCVAGWYPKWFPELGLKWIIENNVLYLTKSGVYDISCDLMEWHKISSNEIKFLFFGDTYNYTIDGIEFYIRNSSNNNLEGVIKIFEEFINLLKEGKIVINLKNINYERRRYKSF